MVEAFGPGGCQYIITRAIITKDLLHGDRSPIPRRRRWESMRWDAELFAPELGSADLETCLLIEESAPVR